MSKRQKLFAPQHASAARAFVTRVTAQPIARPAPSTHAHLCARVRRVAHAIQFVVLAIAVCTLVAVLTGGTQGGAWISATLWIGVSGGLGLLLLGIALRNVAWFLDPDDTALHDDEETPLMRATDRTYALLSWPFLPVIFLGAWLRERSAAAHQSF